MESISCKQTPLKRAMLLYLLWNKHMELYADARYIAELTSPRDLCLWAGFDTCSQPWRVPFHEPIHRESTNEALKALHAKFPKLFQQHKRKPNTTALGPKAVPNPLSRRLRADLAFHPFHAHELTGEVVERREPVEAVEEEALVDTIAIPLPPRVIDWEDMDAEDLALSNEVSVPYPVPSLYPDRCLVPADQDHVLGVRPAIGSSGASTKSRFHTLSCMKQGERTLCEHVGLRRGAMRMNTFWL